VAPPLVCSRLPALTKGAVGLFRRFGSSKQGYAGLEKFADELNKIQKF
jgi:hypothetical protein